MLFYTVVAIFYPITTPLLIICSARGCPNHDEDDEEWGENLGKFFKLFEQIGKFTLIL